MVIELIKENEIEETCKMIIGACENSAFAEFYPRKYIDGGSNYDIIKGRAQRMHFYVLKDGKKIIGCGGIGPYWDKTDEAWIFTVAVASGYQGKGLGRLIIETLEKDDYAKRSHRIEIHAAMSAIPFYKKLGYDHKNGDLCSADGQFELDKYL
ncbi:MAG: GNAT family N-acetyltransferase [Clostridia bacterium]|nr:GNAT family N-acetyltransferase [Clostridia bacterium]